jgi:hypothetical protein
VFRSGRDGNKNLYIMPTMGEGAGLIRLTEGPWDDTMPGWTPASGFIVFASSRAYAGANRPAGAFDLWMVRVALLQHAAPLSGYPYALHIYLPGNVIRVFASSHKSIRSCNSGWELSSTFLPLLPLFSQ